MQVRLIRDWRGYRAGKVFEPQAGAAEILIRRKIAEAIEANEPDAPREAKKKRKA